MALDEHARPSDAVGQVDLEQMVIAGAGQPRPEGSDAAGIIADTCMTMHVACIVMRP